MNLNLLIGWVYFNKVSVVDNLIVLEGILCLIDLASYADLNFIHATVLQNLVT